MLLKRGREEVGNNWMIRLNGARNLFVLKYPEFSLFFFSLIFISQFGDL